MHVERIMLRAMASTRAFCRRGLVMSCWYEWVLSCRAQATQPTRPCRGLGVVVVPRAGDAAEAEVPEKSVYVAEGILGEAWAEATCGSILDRPYSFQMALLIIWLYWKLYLFAVECSSSGMC